MADRFFYVITNLSLGSGRGEKFMLLDIIASASSIFNYRQFTIDRVQSMIFVIGVID